MNHPIVLSFKEYLSHQMVNRGKDEIPAETQVKYVSCTSVWQDVLRNARFRGLEEIISLVDLPCSLNDLQYTAGTTQEMVIQVCSRMFVAAHTREGENPRCEVRRGPLGREVLGLAFIVDIPPPEEEDVNLSIADTDAPSFEEGFSDDEEWGEEEPDDYD